MGAGAEFDLIRRLQRRWGDRARGLGDDAAAITPPRGEQLLVSTDAALEGVHFRRNWLTPRQVAYRAVTAALSDLAAMAAAPLGVLVSLQLPRAGASLLNALADGIKDAVVGADTVILGGNLTRGGRLGVTTTVLGSAFTPLTRAGARPGDLLYVTGQLGGPAAALRAFGARKAPKPLHRRRFVAPRARIAEARWLAAHGVVAAIDISDGLTADAAHVAAASGVGLEMDPARVPVVPGARLADALTGGEEYELLVVARAALAAGEFANRFATPLTAIGRVVAGRGVRMHGARVAGRGGHDHFSR